MPASVEVASQEGATAEASKSTDFERQNPATKDLMRYVGGVFAEAMSRLASEVREFLEEAAKQDQES